MKQNSYRMQYRKRGGDKPTLKNKSARVWQQKIKTWRDAQRTKREDHGAWLNLGSTYNIYKPLSCQVPILTTFNKHLLPTKLIPSEGLRPWHSNFEKYYRSYIVYVSTVCTNLKICQGENNKHLLDKIIPYMKPKSWNKGKSKKEKENEKLKGRQNNSCYSCHRNCKNHLEFESHL